MLYKLNTLLLGNLRIFVSVNLSSHTLQMGSIFDHLPTHSIVDFLQQCPPKTFVRFICCNKQAYCIGEHMIPKKMTESVKRKTEIDKDIGMMSITMDVLPNGRLHGPRTKHWISSGRLYSMTNWKNGEKHGVQRRWDIGESKRLKEFKVWNESKGLVFSYKWERYNTWDHNEVPWCDNFDGDAIEIKTFIVMVGPRMVKFKYIQYNHGTKKRTRLYLVQYNLPNRNEDTVVTRALLKDNNSVLHNPTCGSEQLVERTTIIANDDIYMTIQITDATVPNVRNIFVKKVNETLVTAGEHFNEEKMILVGFSDFDDKSILEKEEHIQETSDHESGTESDQLAEETPLRRWWNPRWWSFHGPNWFIVFAYMSQVVCIRFRIPPGDWTLFHEFNYIFRLWK